MMAERVMRWLFGRDCEREHLRRAARDHTAAAESAKKASVRHAMQSDDAREAIEALLDRMERRHEAHRP